MEDLFEKAMGKLFPATYTGRDGYNVIGINELGFTKQLYEFGRENFYKCMRGGFFNSQFWSVYDEETGIGLRYVPSGNRLVAALCYMFYSYATMKEIRLLFGLPVRLINPKIYEAQMVVRGRGTGRARLYDRVILYAEHAHLYLNRGRTYKQIKAGLPFMGRLVAFMMCNNYYYRLLQAGVYRKIDDSGQPILF